MTLIQFRRLVIFLAFLCLSWGITILIGVGLIWLYHIAV